MPGAYQLINAAGAITPAAAAAAATAAATAAVSNSSIGVNDVAGRAGAYVVDDFMTASVGSDISNFVSGTSAYAGTGSGAVALNAGEAATHPGICCVQTQATGYASLAAYNSAIYCTAASPATYTWNLTFRTPSQLSNSTDTYKFYAGNSAGIGQTYIGTGAGICYTNSSNSGNWMMYTNYPANELEVDTNTSVPFVPAVWCNLQIVLSAGKFTMTLNGTSLGSVTDGSLVGTTLWPLSAGNICMQRTAAGSATISACIDRTSIYITGLNR